MSYKFTVSLAVTLLLAGCEQPLMPESEVDKYRQDNCPIEQHNGKKLKKGEIVKILANNAQGQIISVPEYKFSRRKISEERRRHHMCLLESRFEVLTGQKLDKWLLFEYQIELLPGTTPPKIP